MAADLLTTIRSELDARLGELRPLLAEYERLVAAVDALEVGASKGAASAGKRTPTAASESATKAGPAAKASASPTAASRRRGRPRGSAAGALKRAASTPPTVSVVPGREAPAVSAKRESTGDDTQLAAEAPSRPAGGRERDGAGSAVKAPASKTPVSKLPASKTPAAKTLATKNPRAPRGAAKLAIVAALEHGSHTVSELAVVTAMSGPNINGNIRRLLQDRTIVKTAREGKTAYALAGSVAEKAS